LDSASQPINEMKSARFRRARRRKRTQAYRMLGAGPASLTVANDLLSPLGYESRFSNRMRSPALDAHEPSRGFRLPAKVLNEESATSVDMGADLRLGLAGQEHAGIARFT